VRITARAHLQAPTKRGLRVRNVTADFQVQVPATDDPAELGPCDVVPSWVKTFDTDIGATMKRLLAPAWQIPWS
jgi:ketopantoate reductase